MTPLIKLALRGRLNPVQATNCHVWRGSAVDTKGQAFGIYAKLAEPTQLFADFVCARLAIAAGLPCPQPFLIAAQRDQLPGHTRWLWQGDRGLIFGVASLHRAKKFSRFINENSQDIGKTLRDWAMFWPAAWFDEWIGNTDRNLGNLLVVSPGDYRLIDHDQAFGGSANWLFNLDSTATQKNILIKEGAKGACPQTFMYKGNAASKPALQTFAALTVRDAFDGVPFLSQNQQSMVADYLAARIGAMPQLVCHRLKLPQQQLPLTSPGSLTALHT